MFHQRKAIMTVCKQSNGVWFVFITATQSPKEGFDVVYDNKPNAIKLFTNCHDLFSLPTYLISLNKNA